MMAHYISIQVAYLIEGLFIFCFSNMQVDAGSGFFTLPFISYTKIPIDTSLCNTPTIVATSSGTGSTTSNTISTFSYLITTIPSITTTETKTTASATTTVLPVSTAETENAVSVLPTSASTAKAKTTISVSSSFISYTTHTTSISSGMIAYTHSTTTVLSTSMETETKSGMYKINNKLKNYNWPYQLWFYL